jgi:hypothetical protein
MVTHNPSRLPEALVDDFLPGLVFGGQGNK